MKIANGDLFRRILLNYKRLTESLYSYPEVFKQNSDWPGDFEGRSILALTSLYRALQGNEKEQSVVMEHLQQIFLHIDEFLNNDGYFGNKFDGQVVNEQQLSGNSWYIRGLIDYYRLTGEKKCIKYLKSIVKNYLIPIAPFFEKYPSSIRDFGGVGGHECGTIIDSWKVSTDVGCAFISLDGYTAIYELLPDPILKEKIAGIIRKFLTIDYISLECQTHATLSCTRGILRFYQCTKDVKYLEYAKKIFNKYIQYGMTLDYGNINWFNRPSTWTEPCCIIDSMIISKQLYLLTENEDYLKLFNRIYVNELRTFQRSNGGAGCSTCAYGNNNELKMYLYEAYFCCTMRLSNGFSEIVDFSSFYKEKKLLLPISCDGQYYDDNVDLSFQNDVYSHDEIVLTINAINEPLNLYLYVPNFACCDSYEKVNGLINLTIDKPGKIIIPITLLIRNEGKLLLRGDMLLTTKAQSDKETIFLYNGKEYSPLYDNSQFEEEELKGKIQYV
ncbi:MAG: glycoside hydrolase family 127 protein [Bacillales bacterium]|nr:glycoside hydrolase family 127 protein [Bacillales bacterium]